MMKTKDGYAKLVGTTYYGSNMQILLSNGGIVEYSTSSKESTLVQRNSSQQIYATYFNSAISDEALTDIGSVYVRNTSDSFIRRISKSQFYSIIDGKFVTLDTAQTITGSKTFTTQINSSLSTNTHIEGNKGKTLINSTASAGSYVMLFKGNSTNGYFTHGTYQNKYLLGYTSKATVDEGTNAVTRSATLLDESGNSSFPGNVTVSGTISGNILESRVATGTKPLNITSTTMVTNLNVEMLNGWRYTSFPLKIGGNLYTNSSSPSIKLLNFTRGTEKGWLRLSISDSNNGSSGVVAKYIICWSYDGTNTNKGVSLKCIYYVTTDVSTKLIAVRTTGGTFDLYYTPNSSSSQVQYLVEGYSAACTINNYNTAITTTPTATYTSSLVTLGSIASSATQIKVTQHITNNTNYPVVWSNQNNTNTGNSDLFKSWDHFYYNPSTRKLTISGGIIAGNSIISGTSGNGSPTLKVSTSSTLGSEKWNYIASFLAPNIVSGEHLYIPIGRSFFSKDCVGLDYFHNTAVDSRYLGFNWYGTNTSLYILANGNIGIGVSSPGYKLDVRGSFRASNAFINTGDATLKIYSGKASDGDGKSDGNICFQTSIDSTDGETHDYPTQYPQRCNISLQPRGGQVYIGVNPSTGNTGNKLYVNGNSYTTGYFSGNTLTARVATGTAPLNITSTTLVNNLNVDFLRGYIPIGTSGSVIRKRGSSVGGTTAAWCRMAKYTISSTDTLTDVAFLLHSSYSGRYSVLHIKSRGGSSVKALLYNSYGMDASKIRVYYDSGKSNIEFYYYAGENYSVIIAELLYSTGRGGSWDNNITMYEKDTSSPSYSTYAVPEYPSMQNNADSATKLLNPRKLWGQSFDGTADVSGDMTGVGWINSSLRVDWKNDGVGLRWKGVHSVEFGGNTGYAHTSYYFRPSYSSNGYTQASMAIQNASASNSPTFTTTHGFWADGIGYHSKGLGVAREASGSGVYTNTIYASNWFRSEGDTGWYNQTYGGGWCMRDTIWIRTENNKGVVAVRFDADQGLSGSSWNNGDGAFTVRVHNNSNQTPILLAYRNGTNDTGANRLFALELLNSGSEIRFGMGGKHVAILNNKSELTASLFIGNLSGYASSAGVLHLQGETGSSTGTSLPSNVGMQLYQYYNSGNGPTIYGNFLRIRGSAGGCGELFLGWQGDNNTGGIWYKSKRDVGSWGAWRTVAFTDSKVDSASSADQAIVAEYLSTHYAGGVQTNPQRYFSSDMGLKVAMTGVGYTTMGSYWTDTLWINGYSGGDVKGMCALHFSRQNGPRFAISNQNFDSSSYGTCYEVWTSYNFNPSSLVSDKIKWAIYQINITRSGATSSKKAGNFDYVSSVNRPSAGTAYIYLNYPSGASKSTIIMNATGHHSGTDWNRVVYACLQQDYGTSNSVKLILGNDGVGTVTFMYVG